MRKAWLFTVLVAGIALSAGVASANELPYLRLSNETPEAGETIILKGYGFCGLPECAPVLVLRGNETLGLVEPNQGGRFEMVFFARETGWVKIQALQQTQGKGISAEVFQFVAIGDRFESQQQPPQGSRLEAIVRPPASGSHSDHSAASDHRTSVALPSHAMGEEAQATTPIVTGLGALALLAGRMLARRRML